MIVYRTWGRKTQARIWAPVLEFHYEGWFLLGLLPLYIRRVRVK